jgi:hypothetical protein
MTALAQGTAGIALVMGFALLRTGQVSAAAILLAVQSGAVAVTACVLHQPLMAVPPLVLAGAILGGGIWLTRRRMPMLDLHTAPVGGAKLGIGAGALLAILCQSQGSLALPSAIVLLSILLAATRPHRLMQVVALVAAQNGLALAGSFVAQPALLPAALLLPAACLVLPVPLAAGLLLPARVRLPNRGSWRPMRWWLGALPRAATWVGWIDLGLAMATFAATLIVPLDPLAAIFAPLLGLDGVLRSCVRRNRRGLTPARRISALAQAGFTVLAVCAPNLTVAWLAVLAAMALALLPVLSRRWDSAMLAFLAAGLALFGIMLLDPSPLVFGYFSLFSGFVMIAAVVPELAAVLVILILRLANQAPWPHGIEALGIGIAVIALLACALLLTSTARPHRATLLLLSQASIATLAISMGQAEGRFAALVLLILLILSRSAARFTGRPVATLAMAGLGGVPPFGVFPGLVLVVLAMTAHDPWLLLPLGAALIPIVLASVPRRLPDFSQWKTFPPVAWLPLLLAVAAGYFAPDGLVHWCRVLTAGHT